MEYSAVAELLKRDFDVYMTLVDDQQIDCVIRKENGSAPIYIDVQIKARSGNCKARSAGTFAAMEIRKPRPNFFFIFYSEQAKTFWVMPSETVMKEANHNKTGKNAGKCKLVFCNASKQGVRPRPRFKQYENAFHLLAEYGK